MYVSLLQQATCNNEQVGAYEKRVMCHMSMCMRMRVYVNWLITRSSHRRALASIHVGNPTLTLPKSSYCMSLQTMFISLEVKSLRVSTSTHPRGFLKDVLGTFRIHKNNWQTEETSYKQVFVLMAISNAG